MRLVRPTDGMRGASNSHEALIYATSAASWVVSIATPPPTYACPLPAAVEITQHGVWGQARIAALLRRKADRASTCQNGSVIPVSRLLFNFRKGLRPACRHRQRSAVIDENEKLFARSLAATA
jgi:hypothetical protein